MNMISGRRRILFATTGSYYSSALETIRPITPCPDPACLSLKYRYDSCFCMSQKSILSLRVNNGFCRHWIRNNSFMFPNQEKAVHVCPRWGRRHEEMHGRFLDRLFDDVEMHFKLTIPRGSTLKIYWFLCTPYANKNSGSPRRSSPSKKEALKM